MLSFGGSAVLVLCTIGLVLSRPTASNTSDPEGGRCPGYKVGEVTTGRNFLTASLKLAGSGCNLHGRDIDNLRLSVEYQAGEHDVDLL